eukprot:CAMPEP_0172497426 /NCGR_PEP_ID=MMETSP1066-20121228/99719_1 /TAXON_ID=671091 /ORGANISM="Coscinodiscus wailesii, Strain CCMP2513" /LENGTH=121 /DNA_ID=CAMNT_0013270197 /DNA_START=217 /DNA_END=579 /DNA_ORIENTATION=-
MTPPPPPPIQEVSDDDVLCGRGGATNNHVGNRRFRQLVTSHQPTYLVARKREKKVIAREIVKIVRERGGRFLKKNDQVGGSVWVDVGDDRAVEKTSQTLREGLDVRASKNLGNLDAAAAAA